VASAQKPDPLDRPVLDHIRRDYVSLRADQTVAEALELLRRETLGERGIYFYVTDRDNRLVGVVPTRRLLMSGPTERLADLMQKSVVSLPHTATLLLACEFFVMHRLLAFPVVDREGHLLGLVDINVFTDEIFDLSERQSSDDVFQLIGVRLAQSRDLSPWTGFRRRFPWLLCNVTGGILCALLSGLYEGILDAVIILALFIPVVLALAESVSMQSVTLTLQALHQQRVDWRFLGNALVREFATAVLLGAATGAVVGSVAVIWKHQLLVGLAIGGTICASVITACLLGVLMPIALRVFRGDPRVAAGPIVLAPADIATLLLYFNLSGLLLSRYVAN